MASEVDICNLALGYLGDTATVASLDPPEGSAQAEHCARFYPIARDSLLEMSQWGFATKRVAMAQLTTVPLMGWDYAYAQPTDAVNIISVLDPNVGDELSEWGAYTPQPFLCEVFTDGTLVILTDMANAVLRYTALVTDTAQFSPLFTMALSWHLASMLAGPILKGDAGAAESKRCAQMMSAYLTKAEVSDANQRRTQVQQNTDWISGRTQIPNWMAGR